jgi:hypothetical protein
MATITITTPPALNARKVGEAILGTATASFPIKVYLNSQVLTTIPDTQNDGNWSYIPSQTGTYNFELSVESAPYPYSFAVTVSSVVNPAPSVLVSEVGTNHTIPGRAAAPGKILVYKGTTLVKEIDTNGGSNDWFYKATEVGVYKFKLSNTNGISDFSATVNVVAAPACSFSDEQYIGQWIGVVDGGFYAKSFDNGISFKLSRRQDSTGAYSFKKIGFVFNDSFVAANGFTKEKLAECLSGEFGAIGTWDDDMTLVDNPPNGWIQHDVHQIIFLPTTTRRIGVNVTEFCGATAAELQTGVTDNYGDNLADVSEVITWVDGIEADAEFQQGKTPWVFLRKKNEPTNVSAPFRTLLTQ